MGMKKKFSWILLVWTAMFFFWALGEWSSRQAVAAEVDLTKDMSEELEAEIRANIPKVVFRPDGNLLTNSKTPNDKQILSNTSAIQAALDACAEAGGGIVELPEGYYRVTTQNRGAAGNVVKAGLFIKSGKTWLRGAGKNKTTIETESKFRLYKNIDGVRKDVTEDVIGTGDYNDPSTFNGSIPVYVDSNGKSVFDYWEGRKRESDSANRTRPNIDGINRGDGLRLFEPSGALTDIIISDFTLFGGLKGHNGDYDWWNPAHEINGWDTSHKGINFGHGSFRDRVLLQNMIVREYRGEMLYSGGAHSETSGLQRIIIDNCTVIGSNGSNINVMGKATIKNSTFGEARFFAETVAEFSNSYMHIFNNRFFNSHSGQGYWVTESPVTPKVHANCHVLIYNNVFDNTGIDGVNSFAMRVENNSWNTIIRNNKIYNFNVALWTSGGGVKKGSHILYEGNEIYATTRNTDIVLSYNGVDVQLLNNHGFAANGNRIRLLNANLIGTWGYKGVGGKGADINGWHNYNRHSNYIVKGNRPGNDDPRSLMSSDREARDNNYSTDRPMYVDNVYSQNPTWGIDSHFAYEPNAECLNLTGSGTVRLFDQLYQNGQPLRIKGGDSAVFQTGTTELTTGLIMKQPRTLTGEQTLNLEYRLATRKWHEVGFYLDKYFGESGMTFERMNTSKGILNWSDFKADSSAGFTLKKNGVAVTKLPASATSYNIKEAIAGGGELWELFLGDTMIAATTIWINDGSEQTVLYREGGNQMWFERAGNRGTLTWVRFPEKTATKLILKRNGKEVATLDANASMYDLPADIAAGGELWEVFAGSATKAAASISLTPVQSMTFARTGATRGTLTWKGLNSATGFVLKKDSVTVAEIPASATSHRIDVSSDLPGEVWELFAGGSDKPRLLASAVVRVSEAPQFSVTYDAGGGTGTVPVDTNLYSKGDVVYIKDRGNLTREGYEFLCWNVKPDFTQFPDWFIINNDGKTGIPDLTKYPEWFGFTYAENSKMTMGSLSMPQMGNVTLHAQWIRTGSIANRNSKVVGDKDTPKP